MEVTRCPWCGTDPLYCTYHDTEWGVPVFDDNTLFEFLMLETFQAGLSWITVLRKREHFRKVFDSFNYNRIAQYNAQKIEVLLQDPGIIRNKLKVRAAVSNARQFINIQQQYGSFSNYIWDFVDGKPIQHHFRTMAEVPAKTPLSDKISNDLKKKGFKFVGSTVMYAHMQATGMVNDHLSDCVRHEEIKAMAAG